ncbi:MAG: hypothetical protein JSS49_02365 [Planctomycetes bacterium]|nr:hypothetical protein [Planctomycetota bacterium]
MIMKPMITPIAVVLTVIVLTCGGSRADEPLTSTTNLHLAEVETGQALAAASDTFLKSLSRFDRQVRLQTDGEATEQALIEFIQGEVLAWDDGERQSLVDSIQRLRPKLVPFRLPLPETVVLVLMSGKEEANAAYTRGMAIFLPRDRVQKLKADALDRLVLHELFHVLSRNAPELRRDLYRIVGFELCEPISLPPALADLKLTNPDAPLIDCRIKVTDDNTEFHAAPILYSSSATYDVGKKPPLFKYLTFRLMKIEESEGRWRPLLDKCEPILIDPAKCDSYAAQIGKNTKYIIHPDEILADNFVHLIMQTEKLPSPQIVDQMGERLRAVQ